MDKVFSLQWKGKIRGELIGVSFPFSHVSFRDWTHVHRLGGEHLCPQTSWEPYTLFSGFHLFFQIISERFLYVHAYMCICLVIALPLEATDGPCLLSSQGRRQYGVVWIHGTRLQGCVFCFTHAVIPVTGSNKAGWQNSDHNEHLANNSFGDLGAAFLVLCTVRGSEDPHMPTVSRCLTTKKARIQKGEEATAAPHC